MTKPVLVDLGANRKEVFAFSFVTPDGSKSTVPPKRAEGSAMIGRIPLQPAQSYSQKLLLNEWFDFPTPGQYEISVRLVKPEGSPRGFDIYDISQGPQFRTTLLIQPRDAALLKKICEMLEAQVFNARNDEEAIAPAEALSYINDPIAVPYLIKALDSRRSVEGFAITGLERIGTDEAVRGIELAARSKNKDVAVFAKRALERLGKSPK
jgi:hypothetical protein